MTIVAGISGCGWRGLNSLPLPGTEGNGPGSFVIQAQMPDVNNIQPNSRVRVADVTVGHVTKIERQGWHALVTMRSTATSTCPPTRPPRSAPPACWVPTTSSWRRRKVKRRKASCATARSFRCRTAVPTRVPSRRWPRCRWCSTAAALGQVQDITEALSTAFRGREQDLRSLIGQLDKFTAHLNDQSGDIIAATDSLNRSGRQVRRPATGAGSGAGHHPRRAWRCSTTSGTSSSKRPIS